MKHSEFGIFVLCILCVAKLANQQAEAVTMKLLDFAIHHGADLLPAISKEQIERFEMEHRLKIPPALRDFYVSAGDTGEFTPCGWRIWPFEELATIVGRAGDNPDIECLVGHKICPQLSDYVAFIDAMIECPLYAVCANPSNSRYGEVISLAGDNEPFLAGPIGSMELFERILAKHWEDVVLPDAIDCD